MRRRMCSAALAVAPLFIGCGNGGDLFGSGGAASTGSMGGAGPSTSHTSTGTHAGGGSANGGGGQGGQGQGGQGQGGQGGSGGNGGSSMGCAPDGSKCQVTSDGNAGLCDGQTSMCVDCVDPTDDMRCAAAYGGAYLCVQGSCVAGDCRQNSDCAQMSKDVCGGHTCQVCDAVSNALFLVDPVSGDDAAATGSGTAGGHANSACAFKTVTAAIVAVNAAGTVNATTIQILGPSSVGAGETWPLAIPGNTTVTASGGLVTVAVPSAQTGFSISKPLAAIDGSASGITIDGGGGMASNTPQHGVVTAAGSDTTDFLTSVTLKRFANEAIVVNTGGLTLKSAVTVTTSGQPVPQMGPNVQSHFAVRVGDGAGQLVIDVPAGQTPTSIESNVDGGLQVQGLAKLTINGVPGPMAGTGTVVVQKNPGPGIEISNPAQGQQQASITGVVSFQNGSPSAPAANSSSGIRITVGSSARVRGSVTLANGYSGIHVTANGAVSGSVAAIDLGAPGSPGSNLVQNSLGQSDVNVNGVGICYEGAPGGVASSLLAQGNLFGGGVNCATTVATLTTNPAKSCGNAKDVGTSGPAAILDVTKCSY
jgi:hypothetical protein